MNDTWGISGTAFLVGYVLLTMVVLLVSAKARQAIASAEPAHPVGDVSSRPHDVAYLNGGPELAVLSGLTALRLRGAISSSKGTVTALRGADPGSDELERALFASALTPTNRKFLHLHRDVATALGWARERLVRAGLLLDDGQRRRIRATGWWMAAVVALGVIRLLAGIAGGRPVGFLVVVILLVSVITVSQFVTVPTRSRAGERALTELRSRHHALAPRERPDWRVYGPAGAALGIGMFGASAIWASDPALAGELAAHRAASAGSSGYDGGSGSASGCSGGGSSCGGGGGCGGGGCGG